MKDKLLPKTPPPDQLFWPGFLLSKINFRPFFLPTLFVAAPSYLWPLQIIWHLQKLFPVNK